MPFASVRPKLFALCRLEHIGRQSHVVVPPSADREERIERPQTYFPTPFPARRFQHHGRRPRLRPVADRAGRIGHDARRLRGVPGPRRAGLSRAIEALTRRSLEAGVAGFDYKAVVSEEWRRGNLDDVIDRQVDRAIGELRDESSWTQLWQTLASQEKAKELATTAAERVYRSDALKKALEGVATGIGKEIGKRIELATVDTAGPATQCMQAFLGPRYGATIARIVATGTGRGIRRRPGQGQRPGLHRTGARRRHRFAGRRRRAAGAAAAVQHGLAHRPAGGRLDPRAASSRWSPAASG